MLNDVLLSQTEPVQQSMMMWILSSLGWIYLLLLPLAALTAFIFSLLIVVRGRGPLAAAALLLVVFCPLLIGVFAAFQGALSAFVVTANSASTPDPSELASGISTALIAPLVAMLLSVPAYLTAALGALVRCLKVSAE